MAYLTIEFTGRITANDDEIRYGVERANAVFAEAGTDAEAAHTANMAQIEETGYATDVWTAAEYVATLGMGEGASLAWRQTG